MVINSQGRVKVSVLMPVYNVEQYVGLAIESILNQTFRDIELILINDGSTDRTGEIAQSYHDARIRYISNSRNLGLVASLNLGLEIAGSEIIARMDGDDISMPNRLEKQYQFLFDHQDVGAVGSAVQIVDQNSRPIRIWKFPSDPAMLLWTMIFSNPMAHPSVVMRKSLVQHVGGYRDYAAEDIDLWERLSKVTLITNLPFVLLRIRKHHSNITMKNKEIISSSAAEISERIILRLTHEVPPPGLVEMIYKKRIDHPSDSLAVARLIDNLYRLYVTSPGISPVARRNIRLDAARRLLRFVMVKNIHIKQRRHLLWSAMVLDPFVLIRASSSRISTLLAPAITGYAMKLV